MGAPLIQTAGAIASAAWIAARGLDISRNPHWYVEIGIDADVTNTAFDLNIYPEEWGFVLRHARRVSSIRITDIPFVHGTDDFRLLTLAPSLDRIDDLLRTLEDRLDVSFTRGTLTSRSNITGANAAVKRWLAPG